MGTQEDRVSATVMGAAAGAALLGTASSTIEAEILMDGGEVVAEILREQGVKYVFAVNGGHTWPILGALRERGIQLVHMRHEQSCAFAADAWARTTGTPGVCSVTAGCGLTNAVTGLCTASSAGSAVICIAGQHPTTEDGLGSFQEAYGSEICRSFSKSAKRVLDWTTIGADLRRAFRESLSPPQGVSVVEIPTNILYQRASPSAQRLTRPAIPPGAIRSGADPDAISQAVELLHNSERPLIAAGDGIFWAAAAPEIKSFAELTGIPVYARRSGQGALPETHPQAVRGAWKKSFTGRADVVLAIGFRFWSGERFGEAPTWNERAQFIQADASSTRIGSHVPAIVGLLGDARSILRQLIKAAESLDWSAQRHSAWLAEVQQVRANHTEAMLREAEQHLHAVPIHPVRVARDLCETVDEDATLIIDSFTMSGWLSQWFEARFPGQVLDAGPLAPVGHGVGMAIAAQLARPGKQVVLVIGDGGIGISGFDLETARRHDLPVIVVLWNNSSWGPNFDQMPFLKGRTDPFEMRPDQRYDQIFSAMGCHAERVSEPDAFGPALCRAIHSGVTSVIEVIGDRRVGHPTLGGNLLGSTRV